MNRMQIFFWKYWIARLAICSPHVAQEGGKNTSFGTADCQPRCSSEKRKTTSKLLPLLFQGKKKLARASDNAGFGTSEDELAVHPTNKQPHRPALNLKHKVAGH